MTLELAEREGVEVREPLAYAVAYLHDSGAFAPWRIDGLAQYECSAKCAENVLGMVGYPSSMGSDVVDIIRAHDFVRQPIPRAESRCFHDADILDFMGAVGVTRLLSIVGIEDWTPDVKSALDVIREFSQTLPDKLVTEAARQVGAERQREMQEYLESLDAETVRFAAV
jgi:uncharacterized protein